MARIKYTALVENIRGSIAGTTFQRNAYGFTVKAKPNMVRPLTAFQTQRKIAMQSATSRWRTMSGAERQTWIDYANTFPTPTRLNPDAYLNGFNLFVKYNALRILAGRAMVLSIGLTQLDLSITDSYLFEDSGDFFYGIDYSAVSDGWDILVFMSPAVRGYLAARSNQTRFIVRGTVAGGNAFVEVGPSYLTRLGSSLAVNESYYVDVTFLSPSSAQIVEVPTATLEMIPN